MVPSPQETNSLCDLCGSGQFTQLHEWPVGDFWNPATIPIAVWQCAQCQLVFLHPVPTAAQLPDAGDWWSTDRRQFQRRRWFKSRWAKVRGALIGDSRDRLIRSTRSAVPSGKLLDIGCGCGDLMERARRYYDCVGLEPSPTAAAAVRAKGFPVLEATFEAAEIVPGSFDVVTMDAVIEHVPSPTAALRKINSILRRQGVVALKTPKFGGPAYRSHGPGWNGFRHGYHTFLFTGKTLGSFLEKTGFEVLARPRRDRILDDILILWGRKVRDVR